MPINNKDFQPRDKFKTADKKDYYIWSIAIDNAGNYSEINYLGKYNNNVEKQGISGGGSNNPKTKSDE